MTALIGFFLANPAIAAAALVALESAIMPFVPVKYNGIVKTVLEAMSKKKKDP